MIRVHLPTFNHSLYNIVDQIRFLKHLFKHLGIPFTWAPGFSSEALNLFIECTMGEDGKFVKEFCSKTGKRLGFILTEHIHIENGAVNFNTMPATKLIYADYMGQIGAFERFLNIFDLMEFSRKFYSLGDYPKFDFISEMNIHKGFSSIPFPPVTSIFSPLSGRSKTDREYDFIFTGAKTAFRIEILEELARHFNVTSGTISRNELQRGRLYRNSSFILNIPQNPQWKWSSPMRILAGLCYGRTTVSLQTHQDSAIDAYSINLQRESAVDTMRDLLRRGADDAERSIISAYNLASSNPDQWEPFRKDLFNWAVEEGLA